MLEIVSFDAKVKLAMLMLSKFLVERSRRMYLRTES
jgi:hypothetical protein